MAVGVAGYRGSGVKEWGGGGWEAQKPAYLLERIERVFYVLVFYLFTCSHFE